MTLEQLQTIAAAWFSPRIKVAGSVRHLIQAGHVETTPTVIAVPQVVGHLFAWQPGMPAPDYQSLAWTLEKRWKSVRPQRATLCWATEKAARLTAGVAGFSRHSLQMDHDLGTAACYTLLWQTHPHLAANWIGEDILRRDYASRERWLRKIPDAAIYRNGQVQLLIEFGGQYGVERLRRFHQHCQKHRLPYQLY